MVLGANSLAGLPAGGGSSHGLQHEAKPLVRARASSEQGDGPDGGFTAPPVEPYLPVSALMRPESTASRNAA